MAVREALINAICHRDYGQQGTDISLAMFDDRLEIWNSGLPPAPLKIKDLRRPHKSVLRNDLIANAFYVRGFIEKWGTGINKTDLCKADGVPQPKFSEITGGLLITFKFKEPIGTIFKHTPSVSERTINKRQKIILSFINENKKTTNQQILDYLSYKLDSSPTKRTILRDLNYLKSLGLVDLEGEKKGAVWISLDKSSP